MPTNTTTLPNGATLAEWLALGAALGRQAAAAALMTSPDRALATAACEAEEAASGEVMDLTVAIGARTGMTFPAGIVRNVRRAVHDWTEMREAVSEEMEAGGL